LSEVKDKCGMGWLPDYPHFEDYTINRVEVSPRLKTLGQTDSVKDMLNKAKMGQLPKSLPAAADLRPWCSPVENQGKIGSCTAHAGVGMVEYFERRAYAKHVDASRLFLYKATRNLLRWTGDTGAFIRNTMGALVLFGVPPEEFWPYVTADFDKEPPAFCYAFAQSFQAISYYRLDPSGTTKDVLLNRIKINLAGGLPSMFGFTVYNSYTQASASGFIPYPTKGEQIVGGHAVMAVGYNDDTKILNANPGAKATKGALLIRNSWGAEWGNSGYGWLPYDYVLNGDAGDWWSLLKNEWINSGEFGI
jgi:C1A family cysteine protease